MKMKVSTRIIFTIYLLAVAGLSLFVLATMFPVGCARPPYADSQYHCGRRLLVQGSVCCNIRRDAGGGHLPAVLWH